jgi:hypothetical protein
MMTGLHSGSPSKMIVLAPLLLILLVANSPHHVRASPRGRQPRQLRQDGNGRQLMANTPNPEAPRSLGNIFGRDDESSTWLGPTAAQLPITTQQVATIDCTLPDTGFFGATTSDLVIVPYLFQATLVSNTPLAIINRRITPDLDRGMVEGILPFFFPCDSTGRRRLQLQGITGISAQGEDIPLVGGRKYIQTSMHACYLTGMLSTNKIASETNLVRLFCCFVSSLCWHSDEWGLSHLFG